jgi:hypothetical protein
VCDALGFPNTSFSAPVTAVPSQLGTMSGVLIRDAGAETRAWPRLFSVVGTPGLRAWTGERG